MIKTQLDKGERSVLAYFPSSTKAKKAFDEILEAGLVKDSESLQVDRISRYSVSNDSEYNNPINNASTISGVTIYSSSAGLDQGSSPLLAASDSASGLGNPGGGAAGGQAFMLTAVSCENNLDEIVRIIKSNDGKV